MLLAAGRGTRLGEITQQTPKPLLEIAGCPLIEHQLRALASAGVERVVINLHHLGEQIRQHLESRDWPGLELIFSDEPELLDTGGGIVQALPWLGNEPFIVLNGDIWSDYPLRRLSGALADNQLGHLVLTPRPPNRTEGDFDLVVQPESSHTGPKRGQVQRKGHRPYVQCGISLLRPELFEGRKAQPFSLRELWFKAAADGRLSGEVWAGSWIDIGTPDQLALARQMAKHSRAP
jgi:N-acetyl-alpha-D-muramate 1-phosphate uridylyltransferase